MIKIEVRVLLRGSQRRRMAGSAFGPVSFGQMIRSELSGFD
jgi:hypothetical protein